MIPLYGSLIAFYCKCLLNPKVLSTVLWSNKVWGILVSVWEWLLAFHSVVTISKVHLSNLTSRILNQLIDCHSTNVSLRFYHVHKIDTTSLCSNLSMCIIIGYEVIIYPLIYLFLLEQLLLHMWKDFNK